MTKKEAFILEIDTLIADAVNCEEMIFEGLSPEASKYFEELKKRSGKSAEKKDLTENGAKVLKFMQESCEKFNNEFKAKDIGEGIFTSGRAVSGTMQKLIADGYADKEKKGETIIYSLTDEGKNKEIDL